MSKSFFASCATVALIGSLCRVASAAPYKVFMISSTAPDHLAMSAAARTALAQMGMTNDFTVDATTDPTLINDANLAQYQVFLQMHLAPFEVPLAQRAALEKFIQQGKGWVGVHGAGLIIPSAFSGRNLPPWPFYSNLIGRVEYVIHPALQNGTVVMEDRTHPATRNLPAMFQIRDEWYEWSGNPRPNVRVLGKADERTYNQVKPMGDHPMIWTYESYPRVLYIAIGHDASDWQNASFNILIRDALSWASGVNPIAGDAGADATAVDGAALDGPSRDVSSQDASSPDASSPAGGTAGSGGLGGSGGSSATGGSGGTGASAGGAGGAPAGSGVGAGGEATGGAGGSSAQATSGTSGASTTGSGVSSGNGGTSSANPLASSEGCACRIARMSRFDASSGDASRSAPLLVLVGFALAKRRRGRTIRSERALRN